MDKKPEKLVPEVRFKGFTDDWEQRKFDNVVKRINDKDDNPELPHIEFENIISGNGTLNKNIKNLNSKKIGTKFQKEDILFGKLRPYLKNWYFAKENGIAVGDFWVLRAKKISVFVYYLIQTEKFYSIANLSSGSKMPRSDWNLVSNSRFNFPENTIESIKIGNLILQFDKLITLQQRKLKQLNLLQRYIKEKTLPSQKELPKLRFLTTPYNTYKFSELFKKSTKKNDEQILQNHVISVASMRWGKLPKSSSEAYMKTYFIFNKGDIAYEGNRSKSYSFGRFVANDLGNGIVSHVFSVFNSKINFNLEFLKNYINSEQVMRDPLRMSTSRTTMMTNLVLKDIAKQTLMIPSKDEQDLLGSLYKITQSMIELNEKQQQELIYLKKYLLQKLFI
ncbi:hypothetical protein FMM70_07490 [Lactobacillus reuteri]|uniref:hypothetical protein n=1 Tax=Limosilactobacillus reuteri TaxID=1598 RepID=UPI00138F035A|nr:hypothetical protein [Limosilactobacillus reuteri]NDO57807.1 hypothetical protein [Limosilactobacillus reuteri]